jgi:hypothetical protein
MNDIQPIIGARIVLGPSYRAERHAQGEAADPAHAIDADTHGSALAAARERADRALADLIDGRVMAGGACAKPRRLARLGAVFPLRVSTRQLSRFCRARNRPSAPCVRGRCRRSR